MSGCNKESTMHLEILQSTLRVVSTLSAVQASEKRQPVYHLRQLYIDERSWEAQFHKPWR